MDIITDAQLLEKVEAFLKLHDMAPTRFGREAMGDGALVFQLREGRRSLSLRNAEKLATYMATYAEPSQAAA